MLRKLSAAPGYTLGALLVLLLAAFARAHCDTANGPVVTAGKAALENGDPTPALKWVRADDEAVVRDAFDRARVVRTQGAAAKSLADQFFLETLVRVHRGGEGEPFTGIKPAGTEIDPAIAAADGALESGKPDALIHLVTEIVSSGVRARFAAAADARKHADDSLEKGRLYVNAYVQLIHYVERVYGVASSSGGNDHEREHETSSRARRQPAESELHYAP